MDLADLLPNLLQTMRTKQTRYFNLRSPASLYESKAAEKDVDDYLRTPTERLHRLAPLAHEVRAVQITYFREKSEGQPCAFATYHTARKAEQRLDNELAVHQRARKRLFY